MSITHKIQRTALYNWHVEHQAKMVPFAGWEMPILYTSIVAEHMAVRQNCGIFDVSHMGQIFVEGPGALDFLQMLCTNDIARCQIGQAMYSHICNEQGGVLDDIFVYHLSINRYLIVVNAATVGKDFAWFSVYANNSVKVSDASADFAMIAVQGPKAQELLPQVLPVYPAARNQVVQLPDNIFICRTGYTGEDGFEIIGPHEKVVDLWKKFVQMGAVPCGLGARDTLRLEAGFLLYGSDVDEMHTTVESGPAWVLKFSKKHFIGKQILQEQTQDGVPVQLKAFKLKERGIARHGASILLNGQQVGQVTSGTFSPMLQTGIALGYVPMQSSGAFAIECLGRPVPAEMVTLPFYKKP